MLTGLSGPITAAMKWPRGDRQLEFRVKPKRSSAAEERALVHVPPPSRWADGMCLVHVSDGPREIAVFRCMASQRTGGKKFANSE